jgi:hypothetical protein
LRQWPGYDATPSIEHYSRLTAMTDSNHTKNYSQIGLLMIEWNVMPSRGRLIMPRPISIWQSYTLSGRN